MGIYKIEHKRPEDSHFSNLHYVNFLACSLLASDWFKDNQLLSQLTHAHNRDTVPLMTLPKLSDTWGVVPEGLLWVVENKWFKTLNIYIIL